MSKARRTGEPRTLANLLTPRQFVLAGLVATGRTNPEIARVMRISPLVVKNYLKGIYERSGCWNRVELALRYVHEFEMGLYPGIKIPQD